MLLAFFVIDLNWFHMICSTAWLDRLADAQLSLFKNMQGHNVTHVCV